MGKIIQFITCFNNLGYHTFNKDETDDGTCCLCLKDLETSWHIAAECPALVSVRLQLFGAHGPVPGQWTPSQVLFLLSLEEVQEVILERHT